MKIKVFISIVVFLLIGCVSTKKQQTSNCDDICGIYKLQKSTGKLELKSDGAYTLYKPKILFTPVVEQCEYASKGRWSFVADNLLELTSEDKYIKQKGFEYNIMKENRFSQDSLYVQVIFPSDFHPVELDLCFNYKKHIITDKTFIAIPKSTYLYMTNNDNLIIFRLNADVSGTTIYRGRVTFKIFEEYIDIEKYNYLTIALPNFDRCFFEFEPYYKELIFIKNKNQLFWKGSIWEKTY
ncbi:hypothetical protein [Bacteroides sedimenti]